MTAVYGKSRSKFPCHGQTTLVFEKSRGFWRKVGGVLHATCKWRRVHRMLPRAALPGSADAGWSSVLEGRPAAQAGMRTGTKSPQRQRVRADRAGCWPWPGPEAGANDRPLAGFEDEDRDYFRSRCASHKSRSWWPCV